MSMDLKENYTLVKMLTDLNSDTVFEVRKGFTDIIEHADRNVLLDLSLSTQIDASGIGAIAFLYKRLKCLDFELELSGLKDQPLAIVQSLEIDKIIKSSNRSS